MLSVTVRLESDAHSGEELKSMCGGLSPDRVVERGEPVSSRNPNGPRRDSSRIFFDSAQPGDLGSAIAELAPILQHLAISETFRALAVDLLISASGAPLGSMFSLTSEEMDMVARSGCGLVLDLYCDDEDA